MSYGPGVKQGSAAPGAKEYLSSSGKCLLDKPVLEQSIYELNLLTEIAINGLNLLTGLECYLLAGWLVGWLEPLNGGTLAVWLNS